MRKREHIHISEGGLTSDDKVREWFAGGWEELEKAYGRELSPAIREKIIETVHEYTNRAHQEQNAPYRRDVLVYMKNLYQAAIAFKSALTNLGSGPESRAIIVLIQHQLRKLGGPKLDVSDFRARTNKFTIACSRASVDIQNRQGFVDGDAWRYLIRELSKILETAGLAVGASQETGNSPFVALISAMQANLPGDLRRHDLAGRPSLAKGINRARRDKLPTRDKLQLSRQAATGH